MHATPIARAAPTTQQKVERVLARWGMDTSRVKVTEHSAWRSFNNAFTRPRRSIIMPLFFRVFPSQLGFCKTGKGEVHVPARTGAAVRMHETVHAVDFTQETEMKKQIGELLQDGKKREGETREKQTVKQRVKLFAKDFELSCLLEGRAQYCEEKALEEEGWDFKERMQFYTQTDLRKLFIMLATALTGMAAYTLATYQQTTQEAICLVGMISFCAWRVLKRAEYILGTRFMKKVGKHAENTMQTLVVTAQHPPTLSEIIMPGKYVKRIMRGE